MIRTAFLLILAMAFSAQAQPSERTSDLAPVQVFGTGRQFLNRPLTAKKIERSKIETYQYTDVNRALKQSSGVYAREEDGQGLRPNIGLRGTNPDRSKKISVLEDGVLIGPAPYSAPAAYYLPSMNTAESIEVFKGFAGHPHGPNSVGGAINFLTPPVPPMPEYKFNASAGSYQTGNLKISAGAPTTFGGYLLQASRLQTDGFKKIDGGGETGFEQNHITGKLRWDLSGEGHNLLFTVGYGDENSHETYLGLTENDFEDDAFRRYSSSANDQMKWQHRKMQVRHQIQLGETATLETTIYQHRFRRAWYRIDRFRDSSVNLRDILRDPSAGNSPYYDIARGSADSSTLGATNGQLVMANNDRTYLSEGLQTRFTIERGPEDNRHSFEAFARVHQDEIRRNHGADFYNMVSGRMERTTDARQTDTLNEDKTLATTVSLLDNWDIGTWTLTPLLRWEHAKFDFKNRLTSSTRDRDDEIWLPGFGLTKKIAEFYSLRSSVNRAATLAGLASDGTEKREEATNYELEAKYADPSLSQEANLVLFLNDYRNITGTCTASGGCLPSQLDTNINGGRAKIYGVEVQYAKGLNLGVVHVPVQLAATYLQATFESNFQSSNAEWGVGAVRKGDPLPYVPKVQYTANIGTEYRAWKQDFTVTYQGKVFDQSTSDRKEIKAYGIVDWAGSYAFSKSNRLQAKIDNILDRTYVASARPFGLRPGKPQSFQLGWMYEF